MNNSFYNITMEDVFNGRSEARNRVIAHVFKELGLIEQWGSGINRIIGACLEQGLQTPKIAQQNDFFDIEFYRPRPIISDYEQFADDKPSDTVGKPSERTPAADDYGRLADDKQPEWQQELQQELKDLLEQGIEHEQQELQQELQQESLYGKVLGILIAGVLSTQEISAALGQKSISGQLYNIVNKMREDGLIEWTIPDTPKSPKQRYKLTKRGLAFYALVRKEGK